MNKKNSIPDRMKVLAQNKKKKPKIRCLSHFEFLDLLFCMSSFFVFQGFFRKLMNFINFKNYLFITLVNNQIVPIL